MYAYFRASVRNKTDKKKVFDYFARYVDKLMDRDIFTHMFFGENGKLISNDIDDRWKKLFEYKFLKQV
jgi:hypothetical protein